MKWEDAPAENQKRQEHVSQDCTTHEKYIRTCWESRMVGIGQPWWCSSRNENTHPLRVKRGRNKSAMIVLLMKYKYALPDNQEWRDHVSRDGAAHEIQLRTSWESKVAKNMSDTIALLMKYKCALPDNRENGRNMSAVMVHVQLMEWEDAPTESKVAGSCQLYCAAHEI